MFSTTSIKVLIHYRVRRIIMFLLGSTKKLPIFASNSPLIHLSMPTQTGYFKQGSNPWSSAWKSGTLTTELRAIYNPGLLYYLVIEHVKCHTTCKSAFSLLCKSLSFGSFLFQLLVLFVFPTHHLLF